MPHNVVERGGHLVRFELVCDRPFRKFFGETNLVSKGHVVHLEHHSVNEIVKRFSLFAHHIGVFHSVFLAVYDRKIAFRFKALLLDKSSHLFLRCKMLVAVTDVVGKE